MALGKSPRFNNYSENYLLFANIYNRFRHSKGAQLEPTKELCPKEVSKKPLWKIFGKKSKETEKPLKKGEAKKAAKKEEPPCVRSIEEEWKKAPIPNLKKLGLESVTALRSRNPGTYIVQKEITKDNVELKQLPEEEILKKMERHPSVKGVEDPMPPFVSVEQRLIDLADRKLHPVYKKYIFSPKKQKPSPTHTVKIKSKCSSKTATNISEDEVMECRAKIMEKKNYIIDTKRVEPPRKTIFNTSETVVVPKNKTTTDTSQSGRNLKK